MIWVRLLRVHVAFLDGEVAVRSSIAPAPPVGAVTSSLNALRAPLGGRRFPGMHRAAASGCRLIGCLGVAGHFGRVEVRFHVTGLDCGGDSHGAPGPGGDWT